MSTEYDLKIQQLSGQISYVLLSIYRVKFLKYFAENMCWFDHNEHYDER